MRIAHNDISLVKGYYTARTEAEKTFGNSGVYIEKFIENPHHIEIQILGDSKGKIIHLGERDCSVQRRNQKLIEESPSPFLENKFRKLRDKIGKAAVRIAEAARYTNAGTVEFIVDDNGNYYFLEVNKRIQVEHPVTELVTGLDLVRLQIDIAEGKQVPKNPRSIGHAIEARLYAEDPGNNFLPSTGTVHRWRPPENVRVDTALRDGVEIGVHYDPLLAKIISYGMDRDAALRKLVYALKSTCALGVTTNRQYLIQILESSEFQEGRAHTSFLPAPRVEDDDVAIAAAVLYLDQMRKSPFQNYRNNPYRDPSIKLRVRNEETTVYWRHLENETYEVRCGARTHAYRVHTRVNASPEQITLETNGTIQNYEIAQSADQIFVHSPRADTTIQRLPRHPRPAGARQHETANSPMPGQVLRILVREGQKVKTGDSLVVLEAMKMEQTIRTTINGRVQSVLVKTGQVVAPGQMLVEISAEENES
jgi:acetyl/propionyl-CoA carboxylase alpha subunit